ncbi:MAG: alpha/beta hydrolase, partial [Myxococcales bacterium]|nr:alpha/beta hydrolase [Myxococcales bacterium]
MILNSTEVEQAIDGKQSGRFVKDIVLARPRGPDGKRPDVPLAMVRKRPAGTSTKGAVLLVHG